MTPRLSRAKMCSWLSGDLDLAFTLIQEYEAEFEPPSLREE